MKRFTWLTSVAIVMLAIIMAATNSFSWSGIANNLLVGLLCALLTVSVVQWVVNREQRVLEGLWASEAIFLDTIDVGQMVRRAAEFLAADLPEGVEADEQWSNVANTLSIKRQRLGPLLPKDMLLAVVELEDALNAADVVTARSGESRRAYAVQVVEIWRRYRSLMDRMLRPGDELRSDLLTEPEVLGRTRDRFNLTEGGLDRDEAAAIERSLRGKT